VGFDFDQPTVFYFKKVINQQHERFTLKKKAATYSAAAFIIKLSL